MKANQNSLLGHSRKTLRIVYLLVGLAMIPAAGAQAKPDSGATLEDDVGDVTPHLTPQEWSSATFMFLRN